jgi:hypothetical protein
LAASLAQDQKWLGGIFTGHRKGQLLWYEFWWFYITVLCS